MNPADAIAIILGFVGFVGALVSWSRFKGLADTVTLMQQGNEELRAQLRDKEARIAHLEGQIKVLEAGIADRMIAAVKEGLAALEAPKPATARPRKATR